MQRLWLWIIPLLAAICALWIQAALHGYGANPFAVEVIVRVDGAFPTEAKQAEAETSGTSPRPAGLRLQTVATSSSGE